MTTQAQFGPYSVHHRLGVGGMGDVYFARHRDLDRDVALKLLRPSDVGRKEAVARFRREARVASQLSHPGLVKVFDYGDLDGTHYLAMELVPGRTLHELIQSRGRLAPAQTMDIVTQLLAALQACHEAGLVHRDVKPRNIMVDECSRVRLLDLGLVKSFGKTSYTEEGALVGTPAYLPPEVFVNPDEDLDARADIYQLGVTAHECLAGAPPFGARHLADLIVQICGQPPPPLKLEGPGAASVACFVERALAKSPLDRYASCAEALASLEGSSPAPEPAAPARTRALLRAHRQSAEAPPPAVRAAPVPARVIAAAALLAVMTVASALAPRRPSPPAAGPATSAGAAGSPTPVPAGKALSLEPLEESIATARREALRIVADARDPARTARALDVAKQMAANWEILARELVPAMSQIAAGEPPSGASGARLGIVLTRAFDAWQACNGSLERFLEQASDPFETETAQAEFTLRTAQSTSRICRPVPARRDARLAPELQAGLACLLVLTRPALSGADRAGLDARVTGLVRQSLAQLLSAVHEEDTDPPALRAVLRAAAMTGEKHAVAELLDGALGMLASRMPLTPRLILVEFELRAARVDAPAVAIDRLAAWDELRRWLMATWPGNPRQGPTPGADARLHALAGVALERCRDEVASAARARGLPPPAEPARPSALRR